MQKKGHLIDNCHELLLKFFLDEVVSEVEISQKVHLGCKMGPKLQLTLHRKLSPRQIQMCQLILRYQCKQWLQVLTLTKVNLG